MRKLAAPSDWHTMVIGATEQRWATAGRRAIGGRTEGSYCLALSKRTESKLMLATLRTAVLLAALVSLSPAHAASQDPDLIFRKSTTFKLLTPNDKLAVYGIDDPLVDGIACHYTIPEKGGISGALGLAEQTSDISLA
jgi:CreA protein